jgi:hypothetical protein
MRIGPDHQADVAAFEHDQGFVVAADQVVEHGHGFPGRDAVVAGGDGQGRGRDAAQIDLLTVDPELPVDQQIVLVEVGDVIAEGFAGEPRGIVEPDLHRGETPHEGVILVVFSQ